MSTAFALLGHPVSHPLSEDVQHHVCPEGHDAHYRAIDIPTDHPLQPAMSSPPTDSPASTSPSPIRRT